MFNYLREERLQEIVNTHEERMSLLLKRREMNEHLNKL